MVSSAHFTGGDTEVVQGLGRENYLRMHLVGKGITYLKAW